MGDPTHGARLCMPGKKTGHKYAAFVRFPAAPTVSILRTHPDLDKEGTFSNNDEDDDDDDNSGRAPERPPIVQAVVWSIVAANSSPHRAISTPAARIATHPALGSLPGGSPKKPVLPRGSLPAVEADRDCKKNTCREQHLNSPVRCPAVQRRRPTARPPTSASRSPPPLARSRVKR